MPERVAAWIREGMLRFVSVELLRDVKADTREIPWVLDAVALLGSDQPAVGILKSLTLAKARSTALQCRARAVFTRGNTQSGDSKSMADPTASELMARLDKAEADKKALEAKVAEGESFQRKFAELQQQTHDDKVAAHRKMIVALFEAPIKEKKIIPAVRETFKSVYQVDTDAVLKITPEAVDLFIRANPNPDAPKTPHTAGGADPNDPADKAVEFARKRVLEERSSGSKKPTDQIMVEAFQAQMRSNPDLANAWKSAPGGNA